MSDETSPEQLARVQRLAEAINAKKRLEADDQRSTEDCLRADEELCSALQAVRSKQSEGADSEEKNEPVAG